MVSNTTRPPYIRPSRHWSVERQQKLLAAAGVNTQRAYIEDKNGINRGLPAREAWIKATRPGNRLPVCGLHTLATNYKDLLYVLKEIYASGRSGILWDVLTNSEVPPEHLVSMEAYTRALAEWRGQRGLTSSRARAIGKKGGAPQRPAKYSEVDAMELWANSAKLGKTKDQIASMVGKTKSWFYWMLKQKRPRRSSRPISTESIA